MQKFDGKTGLCKELTVQKGDIQLGAQVGVGAVG